MMITAKEVREMDLDRWSGTITIHSPVMIDRIVRFDARHAKDAARYVLTFEYGNVSTIWKGRTVHVGRMEDGVLELFQYGLRNEGLRHLLFPQTLALQAEATAFREDGRADVLHEAWKASESEPEAFCDAVDDDPLQRCRFWHLKAAFLFYTDVRRLRYWVREKRFAELEPPDTSH